MKQRQTRKAAAYPGRVRIIAGKWRGRWLDVLPDEELRPTGSRIRETLFNWLAPGIEGARCLDLFAGSGALGFEAASRGAAVVVMIDRDPAKVRHLEEMRRRLRADGVEIGQADALDWLAGGTPRAFDIVFLDPPFHRGLIGRCGELLAARGWLSAGASVYMEIERQADMPQLPPGWRIGREKEAGAVRYLLAQTREHDEGGA